MTDQEIRDALRVDPSPEFLARVRTRIASEPAPSAWRWSWTVAAVGALAAMVLIAVVMSRPRHENPSAPDVARAFPPPRATESDALRRGAPKPERSGDGLPAEAPAGPPQRSAKAAPHSTRDAAAHATPVVSGFPPTLQPSSAELRRGQAEAQSAKAGSRTVTQDPEILVDPREGIALQRLLAGVTAGRVNLEPLARAVAQGAGARDDLRPPADIVIPLLPLTPAPGEGDRP